MAASIQSSEVKTIVVACEAGMGSSVMCVNALKKRLKAANLKDKVEVVHRPARAVGADVKLVLVHKGLVEVVRKQVPSAVVLGFNHFLNDPVFDAVVKAFTTGGEIAQVG